MGKKSTEEKEKQKANNFERFIVPFENSSNKKF
jgi:hypothetical protein